MARIETSTNLVGKSITLIDGTKAKIIDAIASGYKTDKSTKRVSTRCVVKKGSGFAEIAKLPMSQLTDTGEGYVELKAAVTKAPVKAAAKTTAAKTTAKAKTPAKETKPVRTKRNAKAEAPAEPVARVRRKKSVAESVALTKVTEAFTVSLAERVYDLLKDNDVLKFDADNVTPISNDVEVTYDVEFAEPNKIHMTFGLSYALPADEPEAAAEMDDAVIARAAKKVGKTVGKKLAVAIKKAFGMSTDEFQPGVVLSLNDAQFVYCGPSKDDADTAYLYSSDSDKFRAVSSVNLAKYSIVEEDEEEEEEEELDEDEDFDDEEEEELDGEEEEAEDEDAPADDAEYSYYSVTKEHLAQISKSVGAKYHDKMATMWGVDADVLVPGLVLTDGETTFAYVGFNAKGGLVVIDIEDGELMVYKKADVDTLSDFAAVLDNDDAESADDTDEEEAEEEEDGNDDFDFDDAPESDFADLSHDELIDKVVELGLAKPRKAANMSEDDLRELLA